MFGYGPFEYPVVDVPAAARPTPLWVRVALVGPFVMAIAWALVAACGLSPSWLFWVVVGSLSLGYGSVLAACLYHLAAKCASRGLPTARRS
jgi:hypothetical protein